MGMTQKIAAKPLTPEKLQEVMLKIRKGATASLTLSQIVAVVEALGGSIKPIVGLVNPNYKGEVFKDYVSMGDDDSTREAAKRLWPYKVSVVPSNPKPGMLYVTDISEEKKTPSGYLVVEFNALVGVQGVHISLGGDQGDILPDWNDVDPVVRELKHNGHLGEPRKLSLYRIQDWLKEHGWKEKVNAYLNMEEHVPAAQRTRDSTGTCPVCFQNVKIQPGSQLPLIVLHGYKRPRYGYVVGKCEGTRFPPFELSVQGTESYLERGLKATERDFEAKLASLKADDLETLTVRTRVSGPKVLHKGDPDWDKYLNISIENISGLLGQVREDIKIYTLLVQHWKERPLPREGEKLHDWYTEGRKASLQESVVLRHLASIVARRHLAR